MQGESNHPGGGDFFVAVPLKTEDHAATVEVVIKMVRLAFLGPVTTHTTTLTRGEARSVALAVMDASQQIEEE
jgi:hypothetical protein